MTDQTAVERHTDRRRASLEASLRRFLADQNRGPALPEPPAPRRETKARVVTIR